MSKILVTGVTGFMGRRTVEHLLKKGVPAGNIIGLARKMDNVADLATQGVEIRLGDYLDYNSLLRAFKGVDKVMLTSAVAFTDRFKQHLNVINAARQAGVKHLVYMAIIRKNGSERVMPEVTPSDIATEDALKASGLDYTIVYHPPFTDLLWVYYGNDPYNNGIKVPAATCKMAPATRDELAEAHAEILSSTGHENKTYSLGGSEAISFADIANILSEIKGQSVKFAKITVREYTAGLMANDTPSKVAEFLTHWIVAISEGEFEYQSGDLERLLGRKTRSFKEYIASTLK